MKRQPVRALLLFATCLLFACGGASSESSSTATAGNDVSGMGTMANGISPVVINNGGGNDTSGSWNDFTSIECPNDLPQVFTISGLTATPFPGTGNPLNPDNPFLLRINWNDDFLTQLNFQVTVGPGATIQAERDKLETLAGAGWHSLRRPQAYIHVRGNAVARDTLNVEDIYNMGQLRWATAPSILEFLDEWMNYDPVTQTFRQEAGLFEQPLYEEGGFGETYRLIVCWIPFADANRQIRFGRSNPIYLQLEDSNVAAQPGAITQ